MSEKSGKDRGPDEVAGVRLTSGDRVLWPDAGVTKRALAEHWVAVAGRALPLVAGRPLTLVRCPAGLGGECFYQKRAHDSIPDAVPRIELEDPEEGPVEYLMVDGLPAIVSLVQVGALELHVRGARADDLDRPERLVIDLDPGPGVGWTPLKRTAVELKDRLADAGLRSFPLVTGGKGLHVVAPLVPGADWDALKAFARGLAETMAEARPNELTSRMPKKYRRGRIFIDYLRNDWNATAIAPWSPRARPGAPVAMPMAWDELARRRKLPRWSVQDARKRAAAGDPWAGYERARTANARARIEAGAGS